MWVDIGDDEAVSLILRKSATDSSRSANDQSSQRKILDICTQFWIKCHEHEHSWNSGNGNG